MIDGIFDDRLQEQAGYDGGKGRSRCIDTRRQAITKARALNAEVQIEQFEFALQRYLIAIVVEVDSQQFAQPQQQVLRDTRVFLGDHRRDRVVGDEL
jgi:hypothetical protein